MPAAVAPQQAFEPMVMVALADTAATPERQHPLDAVVGFLAQECGVSAGVLLIVVGDFADVVAVTQDFVELAE